MELEKCFAVLELQPGADLSEIKAAYRDAVAVWHPDRFAGNPRLKDKAEKKLKEINLAYETLLSHYNNASTERNTKGTYQSNVEAVAEAGTRLVLQAFHFIVKKFKEI